MAEPLPDPNEDWPTVELPVVRNPVAMTVVMPHQQVTRGERILLRRRIIKISLAVATIAYVLGYIMAPSGTSSVHVVTVRTTKTVTARPVPAVTETRTVVTTPESCQAAMTYVSQLEPYANTIIDTAGPAMDALQDAFIAISQHDVSAINKAQSKLQQLDNALIAPESQYMSLLQDAQTATAACLKQIND